MPRGAPATTRTRRTTRARVAAGFVVTHITQLVAANERLQRANRELTEENERLRSELTQIGSALGSLTGGRRGRGRRGAAALALPEAKPRRQRRPITDPEVLARRNAALAKARAARAEKLAAALAGAE
jgi:cell division septum initiation protein DivIVA